MTAVEVCPICDIAGCRHIRDRIPSTQLSAALRAERDALQQAQTYRYIGKDGKPILARDLEDQRDAALVRVDVLEAAVIEAREQAHSLAHSEFDGHWSDIDFAELTPLADAALAGVRMLEATLQPFTFTDFEATQDGCDITNNLLNYNFAELFWAREEGLDTPPDIYAAELSYLIDEVKGLETSPSQKEKRYDRD